MKKTHGDGRGSAAWSERPRHRIARASGHRANDSVENLPRHPSPSRACAAAVAPRALQRGPEEET
eukprot:2460526-Pyramimonas_sp.AAC.1